MTIEHINWNVKNVWYFFLLKIVSFILFQCHIYLQTNSTDCQIPCVLTGCDVQHRPHFKCPIWICKQKSSTTSTTTTTTSDVTTSTIASSTPAADSTTTFPKPDPASNGKLLRKYFTLAKSRKIVVKVWT